MNQEAIKQLLKSEEPIAIVRFFEWAIFSRSYDHPKYSILMINPRKIDIEEIEVPDKLTSFLVSQLPEFEKVIQEGGGSVWERHNFREKVKRKILNDRWLCVYNDNLGLSFRRMEESHTKKLKKILHSAANNSTRVSL